MAYKKTYIGNKNKNKNRNKTIPAPKVNVTNCPEDMTLEEWQRGLRKLAAEKESFGIAAPAHPGDPFIVASGKSGRKYRVNYYGPSSCQNRCECMDFKTSRLGTCKHIEAISLANNGRYARKKWPAPDHTFVYVDYVDDRKIKICKGEDVSDEMNALINELFDDNGVIKDSSCDPSDFIRKARTLDESFEWETDALNLIIESRDKKRRTEIIEKKYAGSDFEGLLNTKLHPYQVEGVKFAFKGGRTINADEMGLGKTVQAIATAELLRREGLVESVIIICPTSLKYQWLSEIKRFTNSPAIVVEGNLMKRKDQLNDPGFFYKICSFHAMSNNIKGGFIPDADMIIYDELQRLKNRDTQMGKQLRKLESQYVLALSGTPLENRIEELYSVTQLVDQFIFGPLYQFNAETTLKDDMGKVTGYRNLHSVADKLKNTLIRRRKVDVKLQMPSRTDTNLYVPLTKEQRAMHDEYQNQVAILIHKWRRMKFLSEKDRKQLLLFLSMMRMVCDSTYILDQKSRHDTKIDEVMAIIDNLLSDKEGKVVIFSQWERMLRILATQLEEEDIAFCFLHGGVPSPKRKNLIDRFRDDPDCRIFLSTDAGATGLNLQAASLLINIDLPWNPAVLEQRVARIYRLGQNNPVQIINMVARNTIEERMLSTLRFKSNLAAGILDGGDDTVFLENKKFDKIIEVVDNVINEPQAGVQAEAPAKASAETLTETAATTPAETATGTPATTPTKTSAETSAITPTETSAETQRETSAETPIKTTTAIPAETPAETPTDTPTDTPTSNGTPRTPGEMKEFVAGGMAFLGKLADVLRKPESAQTLADVLVKEDPDTGKASLNIPVPDKASVVNILSAFSALLNK